MERADHQRLGEMFASRYEALSCRSHGVSQESRRGLRSSIDVIPVYRRAFQSVTRNHPRF